MGIDFVPAAYTNEELESELADALFDRDEEDLDGERMSQVIQLVERRTLAMRAK